MQSNEPIMQVLSATIEHLANRAIDFSSNGKELLQPLASTLCIIHLQEFSRALLFHVTGDKIRVGVDEDSLYEHNPEEHNKTTLNQNECWLSVSIFAFDKLKQKNQLTKLIKTGQLDFAGDLTILQSLSALFAEIDIDFEEILSKYVGDVAAYQLNSTRQQLTAGLRKQLNNLKHTITDTALDEKPIGVRKIMLINFCDEVSALNEATSHFEAQLAKFEAKLQAKTEETK